MHIRFYGLLKSSTSSTLLDTLDSELSRAHQVNHPSCCFAEVQASRAAHVVAHAFLKLRQVKGLLVMYIEDNHQREAFETTTTT